jgi:hypothetical protein
LRPVQKLLQLHEREVWAASTQGPEQHLLGQIMVLRLQSLEGGGRKAGVAQ